MGETHGKRLNHNIFFDPGGVEIIFGSYLSRDFTLPQPLPSREGS
jgi:hypothetical protein